MTFDANWSSARTLGGQHDTGSARRPVTETPCAVRNAPTVQPLESHLSGLLLAPVVRKAGAMGDARATLSDDLERPRHA